MNEHLDEKLSALIDGELEGDELRAAEVHLTECGECRALLEELRTIARHAGALDDRAPERDLWAGISARISQESIPGVLPFAKRRRFAFSVPQLAAAAVALMAVSAGSAAIVMQRSAPESAAFSPRTENREPRTAVAVSGPGAPGIATYDAAIRELELTLAARRNRLDTATVRIVEQSLRIIDLAINQARAALDKDTTNLYLNSHLQDAMERKLDLLRRVATLPRMS